MSTLFFLIVRHSAFKDCLQGIKEPKCGLPVRLRFKRV
jgi:hypothetical protein